MRLRELFVHFAIVVAACWISPATLATGQAIPASPRQEESSASTLPQACAACIRNNLAYLAGPTLHGRGSGTEDERHAAEFVARKLKQYGLAPAAEDGQYIQTATLRSRKVTKAPVLFFDGGDAASSRPIEWTHGKEMVVFTLSEPDVAGPLQKLDLNDELTSPAAVKNGAVVLLKRKPEDMAERVIATFKRSKAAMLILSELPDEQEMFERRSKRMPRISGDRRRGSSSGCPRRQTGSCGTTLDCA